MKEDILKDIEIAINLIKKDQIYSALTFLYQLERNIDPLIEIIKKELTF